MPDDAVTIRKTILAHRISVVAPLADICQCNEALPPSDHDAHLEHVLTKIQEALA